MLLLFAATLEPVQSIGRMALGLAGIVPLAVTMSGRVTDDGGTPIRHAFVRIGQDAELATTYTDEHGMYEVRFAVRTRAPADVSFGATGYEASVRDLQVASTDEHHDAMLRPLIRIDSGKSLPLEVTLDDGPCRLARTDAGAAWPCRLVHVSTTKTGLLSISVVGDDPRDRYGVAFAVGSEPMIVFAESCCGAHDAVIVPEGADAVVQIVALGLDPATRHRFTLHTTVDPP